MTVLPPGCISLDEAMARLGPLLMGKDWIPELTPHELWLLERERAAQIRDDGLIVPIKTMIASQGEKPEVSAVRDRLEEAMWQRQRCKAWLRRNKLAQGQDGAMAVNKRALEAALTKRFGPAGQAPHAPRGRKPKLKSIRGETSEVVLEILESRKVPPKGRLREIAKEVKRRCNLDHTVDAIEEDIRPVVRQWEAKHPGQ